MGDNKYRTPQKIRVKADIEELYDELAEAKDIAEEYSPNKETK